MRRPKLLKLLQRGEVRIVGSVLRNNNPRDVDVLLILPDELFEQLWMPPVQWMDEGRNGIWTRPRWRWARDTLQLSKVLASRLLIGRMFDFQIVPKSGVYSEAELSRRRAGRRGARRSRAALS